MVLLVRDSCFDLKLSEIIDDIYPITKSWGYLYVFNSCGEKQKTTCDVSWVMVAMRRRRCYKGM